MTSSAKVLPISDRMRKENPMPAPVLGITERINRFTVERKPSRFGTARFDATEKDTKLVHEVVGREYHGEPYLWCSTCGDGTKCDGLNAVLHSLWARSESLLPSRQLTEGPKPEKPAPHFSVSYALTDDGKHALAEPVYAWCTWCDERIDCEDALTTVDGEIVHRGDCAIQKLSDGPSGDPNE